MQDETQEVKTPLEKLEQAIDAKEKILFDMTVQCMLLKKEIPLYKETLKKLKGEKHA